MSDDPETMRQILELSLDTRPLLVLDVDDVILEFIGPFPRYVEQQGYRLKLDSFRLHGNVVDPNTGVAIENDAVSALIDSFFGAQDVWQTVVDGAAEAISDLAKHVEIVLLTAMPHRHRATRRAHLDQLGLTCPLLTTEQAKGPAIRQLRGPTERPVAFVDDIPRNLLSVRDCVPDAHLFHLMADIRLRPLLPTLPEGIMSADSWRDAAPRIATALGVG